MFEILGKCPSIIKAKDIHDLTEVQESFKEALKTYGFIPNELNQYPKLLVLFTCCEYMNLLLDKLEKENRARKSVVDHDDQFQDLLYIFFYALADRNLLFRPKTCVEEMLEFSAKKIDDNDFIDKAIKLYLHREITDKLERELGGDKTPDIFNDDPAILTDQNGFILYIKNLRACWNDTYTELDSMLNSYEAKQYIYKDFLVLKSRLYNKERGRKNLSTKPKAKSGVTTLGLNPHWEEIKEALVKNLHSRNVFGENGILGRMNETYIRIVDDALIAISNNYLLQKCVPLYLYFCLLAGESGFDTSVFLSDLKQKGTRIKQSNSTEGMKDEQRYNCNLFFSILLACLSVPELMCGQYVLNARRAVEIESDRFGIPLVADEVVFLINYTDFVNTFSDEEMAEYESNIHHRGIKQIAKMLKAISTVFWYQTWNSEDISLNRETKLKRALMTVEPYIDYYVDDTTEDDSNGNCDEENPERKYEPLLKEVLEIYSSYYCAFSEELFWFVTGYVPSDNTNDLWYIRNDRTEKFISRPILKYKKYYAPSFYLAIDSKFEELWFNSVSHLFPCYLPPEMQGQKLRKTLLKARLRFASNFDDLESNNKNEFLSIIKELLAILNINESPDKSGTVQQLEAFADNVYYLNSKEKGKKQSGSTITRTIKNELLDELCTQVYIFFRTTIFKTIGKMSEVIWPINTKDIKNRLPLPDRYDSPGGDA